MEGCILDVQLTLGHCLFRTILRVTIQEEGLLYPVLPQMKKESTKGQKNGSDLELLTPRSLSRIVKGPSQKNTNFSKQNVLRESNKKRKTVLKKSNYHINLPTVSYFFLLNLRTLETLFNSLDQIYRIVYLNKNPIGVFEVVPEELDTVTNYQVKAVPSTDIRVL